MKTLEEIKAEIDMLPKHEAREYIFKMLDRAVELIAVLENTTTGGQHTAWVELKSLLGAPPTAWEKP